MRTTTPLQKEAPKTAVASDGKVTINPLQLKQPANNPLQLQKAAMPTSSLVISEIHEDISTQLKQRKAIYSSADPIQFVRLDLSKIKEIKQSYGGDYGPGSYYSAVVKDWLESVKNDHPEAKKMAEQAITVFDEHAFTLGHKASTWDGLLHVIKKINDAIPEKSSDLDTNLPEEKKDEDQEGIDEDEDENLKPPILNISSNGSQLAVDVETFLDKGKKDFPSAKAFLNVKSSEVIPVLKKILEITQTSTDPNELLQLHRLTGTFEFRHLIRHKQTKKICISISEALTQQKLPNTTDLLLESLNPDWAVMPEIQSKLEKSEILDAPHGKDTKGSNPPINDDRLKQTIAEMILMRPMLDDIIKIGTKLEFFKSTADFSPLIIRTLEGSVRRFKANTILDLLQVYSNNYEHLKQLKDMNKITVAAFEQIGAAMRMAAQGEGHRAKEQKKMFLSLLQHLEIYPAEVLVEYEPDSVHANYDIRMENEDKNSRVMEVESIPANKRADAYNFYKERYQHKLHSIKLGDNTTLFITIPPLTRLPVTEIIKIKEDPTLKISNIDQIKSS